MSEPETTPRSTPVPPPVTTPEAPSGTPQGSEPAAEVVPIHPWGSQPPQATHVRIKKKLGQTWSPVAIPTAADVDVFELPVEHLSPETLRTLAGPGSYKLLWLSWDGSKLGAYGWSREFVIRGAASPMGAGGGVTPPASGQTYGQKTLATDLSGGANGPRPSTAPATAGALGEALAGLGQLGAIIGPVATTILGLVETLNARYRADADHAIRREHEMSTRMQEMMSAHYTAMIQATERAHERASQTQPIVEEFRRLHDRLDDIEDDMPTGQAQEEAPGWVGQVLGAAPDIVEAAARGVASAVTGKGSDGGTPEAPGASTP